MLGFMQGRLSPKPEGRIQAFPRDSWREEFSRAVELGFDCIELIYDVLHLNENPLSSDSGRRELRNLSCSTSIRTQSICADYFMVKLLTAANPREREENCRQAEELLGVAQEIGCPMVEFPFVDSSSVTQLPVRNLAIQAIQRLSETAVRLGLKISVETDLSPVAFGEFLNALPVEVAGANLDLGNSASLGYDVMAECRAFGSRIFNVHVKDRVLGGATVPLKTGHVDFERAFRALGQVRYRGDFILQTAPDPNYMGVAAKYRQMVLDWIRE